MKRFLSLLLALLFCLSFIVSCEKEEAPSTSESSSRGSSTDPENSSVERELIEKNQVSYYYSKHYSFWGTAESKTSMVNDMSELLCELEVLNKDTFALGDFDEKIFATHYVIVVVNKRYGALIGYHDFRIENDSYILTASRFSEYGTLYLGDDGMGAFGGVPAPEAEESIIEAQGKSLIDVEVVAIPKSELDEPLDPSKEVFLDIVLHHISVSALDN